VSSRDSTADQLAEARERVRRLEAVVEAGVMVNSTLDLAELAEHVIGIATRLINAERGSLFLVDRETGRLRSMVAQGLTSGPLTVEMGEGVVGAVAASGEAEILDDPYADSRFDPRFDQLTGYRTRSLLTVPVRDREGFLIAVLQLLNHRGGGFSGADVEFLEELGVPFAIALTTADLHREIVAREQLRREVRLAAEIQRALQPEDRADVPGLDIEVLFEPCHEVGGDYWDVIPIDDDRWWIVVADVFRQGRFGRPRGFEHPGMSVDSTSGLRSPDSGRRRRQRNPLPPHARSQIRHPRGGRVELDKRDPDLGQRRPSAADVEP